MSEKHLGKVFIVITFSHLFCHIYASSSESDDNDESKITIDIPIRDEYCMNKW